MGIIREPSVRAELYHFLAPPPSLKSTRRIGGVQVVRIAKPPLLVRRQQRVRGNWATRRARSRIQACNAVTGRAERRPGALCGIRAVFVGRREVRLREPAMRVDAQLRPR